MSNITSQNLTELIKNIKDKKISSEEVTKSFIEKAENSMTERNQYNIHVVVADSSVLYCDYLIENFRHTATIKENLKFYCLYLSKEILGEKLTFLYYYFPMLTPSIFLANHSSIKICMSSTNNK